MSTIEIFLWSIGASIAIGGLLAALLTCVWLEVRTIGPMRRQVDRYRFDAIQASEHLKQVRRELGQRRLVDLKAGAPSSTIDLFLDNDRHSMRADLRVAGGPKRNRAV